MLRINLKIALRNIWKHKLTTSIKLLGLIAGLTSVVLLVAYVMFELSYDKQHKNADRIFRLHTFDISNRTESIRLPSGMVEMMKEEIPEVEAGTFLTSYETQLKVGENTYTRPVIRTRTEAFDLFTLPFVEGSSVSALKEPGTAIISADFAKLAFPNSSAIGKSIFILGESKSYRVTGVMSGFSKASHVSGDVLVTSKLSEKLNWSGFTAIPQYIMLRKGASPEVVMQKMKRLYKKYKFPEHVAVKLMPLTMIHLYSHTSAELEPNSDIKYIYIFSIVAFFILLIAIVNFVNLTVAASLKRSKEIGIKKVLGASMKQLRIQFLSESYLYFILAALFVLIITVDLVPFIGLKLGIPISFKEVFDMRMIVISFTVIIISGFIAGFYPAVILSGMMPVNTLKGYTGHIPGKGGFKKALMGFQFAISALMIVSTLVIYGQLKYISTKNLGFDRDQVIYNSFKIFDKRFNGFRNDLLKENGIKSVSLSSFNPGVSYGGSSSWTNDNDSTKFEFDFVDSDIQFKNTLNLKIIQGRYFSERYGSDLLNYNITPEGMSYEDWRKIDSQRPIVLNETAMKKLGLHSVDTVLTYGGLQGKVIGVVQDFNGMSLHNKVTPVAIRLQQDMDAGYTYIKTNTPDAAVTRAKIDEVWKKHFPEILPDLQFLDQHLEKLYASEIRLGTIFIVFAGIAVFLSCIGLLGMVYFELEQRTKEIAIRKVLGASMKDLLTLMNRSFIITVVISNVIVWPIAYLLINQWLSTFYYRITLSYQPFLYTAAICLAMTIITVSAKALKTVKQSPVDSLKYE